MIAGNEQAVPQFAIEEGQEIERARLVGLAPFGHLLLHILHGRMQVAKNGGHRCIEIELDAAVPHLDQRLFLAAASEQGRLGPQSLEVAADRDRLRDHRAVVEHQHRQPLHRIERREGVRLVCARAEVDWFDRDIDAFLGQEDAHPPRIWRPAAVIELHDNSICTALDHALRLRVKPARRSDPGRARCRAVTIW